MAEALVDDMTTKTKTESHKQAELDAEQEIITKSGEQIRNMLIDTYSEYEQQVTGEAQFVKAIDKVEPIFHMYFLARTTSINKDIFKTKDSGWTMEEYRTHRRKYIENHSLIWSFDTLMTPIIDKAGFFKEWA